MKKLFPIALTLIMGFHNTQTSASNGESHSPVKLKTPRPPQTPKPDTALQQSLTEKLKRARKRLKAAVKKLAARGKETLRATIDALDRELLALDSELKKTWVLSESKKVIDNALKKVDAIEKEVE